MRLVIFVACALCGCIGDNLVECPDGLTCPIGTVCDVAHHSCTTQEQLDACSTLPDRAPCLVESTCHEGVCLPDDCGNARVDSVEACDDGNASGGDGCASDCSSDEVCGNGIIDLVRGETCDDANRRSHDGCDSQCASEHPRWRPLGDITSVSRYNHAGAYDELRRRFVIFGGNFSTTPDARAGTFEFDDHVGAWFDVSPAISPPGRYLATMTYDAARRVIVLFGGANGSAYFGDTWIFDGNTWTDVSPINSPSPRFAASIAYDGKRQRVVLFGGFPVGDSQVWEWDGSTWTASTPSGSPPPRSSAPMTYDPIRGEVVMRGGYDATSAVINDGTWIYDGASWRNETVAGPTNVANQPMTFDPSQGGIVLAGGGPLSTAWRWNGTSWTQLADSGLSGTYGFVQFFDPTWGEIVVHGGVNSAVLGATLGFSSTSYSFVTRPTVPIAFDTIRPALAYDSRRHTVVRFGGTYGSGPTPITYELVGDAWIYRLPPSSPPARNDAAMTYDPKRGRIVMFGGGPSGAPDDQTWEWDGTGWASTGAIGPPRRNASLVYDVATERVMLYGGTNQAGALMSETWILDGTQWTKQSMDTPPPRTMQAMAYDDSAHKAIMFGGVGNQVTGATWTWDATTGWAMSTPAGSPSLRYDAGAAYDPLRREVVLFAGTISTPPLDDTWRWAGDRWVRLDIEVPPLARTPATLVYDQMGSRFISVGPDTWTLRWQSHVADELCLDGIDRDGDGLAGCADPDCDARCSLCGNATCDPIEDSRSCPTDCGAYVARCGDWTCDPPETAQNCPGDCP